MKSPPSADALPPFPGAAPPPPLDETLRAAGIVLWPAGAADLPFLKSLYAGFRMPELLFAPWTLAQKQAFAEDQFRPQHIHFVHHFAAADFWVVMRAEPPAAPRPIGRLYLDRSGPEWRLVDIILNGEARGQGLGAALISWVQKNAAAAGAESLALHVAVNNPRAQALYLRLGFQPLESGDGLNVPMRWRP